MPGALRSNKGGNLNVRGGGAGVSFQFHVEGLSKVDEEFKAIRKGINTLMRDTVVQVGEREILPTIRTRLTVRTTPQHKGELAPGRIRSSMYVKRDRTTIQIASRLTGKYNRALGWLDFGGARTYTTKKGTQVSQAARTGPKVILHTVDEHRPGLDRKLLDALITEFRRHDFEVV